MNYYNENDKFAANWLRELIKAKLIPEGYVDELSIIEVKPEDLEGFKQCHFFVYKSKPYRGGVIFTKKMVCESVGQAEDICKELNQI